MPTTKTTTRPMPSVNETGITFEFKSNDYQAICEKADLLSRVYNAEEGAIQIEVSWKEENFIRMESAYFATGHKIDKTYFYRKGLADVKIKIAL